MLAASLLIIVFFALGVCDANNALAIKVPSYAFTGDEGVFWLILYALLYAILGLFGLLPLPELGIYQVIALATLGCALFTRHIIFGCLIPLSVLPAGEYVIFIILALLAVGVSFLSLNIKFRHLFGSIGAGYILAYELILIFAVASYSLAFILFIASIGIILIISKFSDFLLNCIVRAVLVPFCFLLAVNSIILNVFLQLHYKESYRAVTVPIAICLALGTIVCFFMVFFQRQIKEKVDEFRSGSEEKVETVKDDEEENV